MVPPGDLLSRQTKRAVWETRGMDEGYDTYSANRSTSSIGPMGKKHDANRFEEQKGIHPGRPVADVIRIQLNALFVGCVVAARYLPQARDAGFDHRIEAEIGAVFFDLFGDDRPRSDEAHVAADHVPKLRQLIEASLAQEAADAGNSRIVAELVVAFPFLFQIGIVFQILFQDEVRILGTSCGTSRP